MTRCQIDRIAFGGDGIGRIDQYVVFVPFTAPGDIVEVSYVKKKKSFAQAKLLKIVSPGPDRVPPPCPVYGTCGGCQLQHLSYAGQLESKRAFIQESLQRIGKISFPVPPVIPSPVQYGYRRHIRLRCLSSDTQWTLGFTPHAGADLLPIRACPLFEEDSRGFLSTLQDLFAELLPNPSAEGSVKIFKTENSSYLVSFEFAQHFPQGLQTLCSKLLSSPLCQGIACRTSTESFTLGNPELFFSSNGLRITASPFGFIQNHPDISEKIYEYILSYIESSNRILDLYCGIGITSLLCAKRGLQVLGIEMNEQAVACAQQNAILNYIENAEFRCSTIEACVREVLSSFLPDCILINPPRIGIEKQALIKIACARKLVYVSCYPPTLARDLQILLACGYSIQSVQGFDMFPQTTHVETVVFLEKNHLFGQGQVEHELSKFKNP